MLSNIDHHNRMVASVSDEIFPEYRGKSIFGLRISALIEIALFFAVALLADILFFDGSRFFDVEPHPFWMIVLLISAQYGTSEGVFAAFVSCFWLLVWNMPEQQLDETTYDYLLVVVKNPIMWLAVSVILGEIRARHLRERITLSEALADAREHERVISDAYTSLKRMKEKLETHMAGELRSSINAYNAMKSLGALNPSRTLLGVEEVVKAVLDPEKFSVYALGAEGLESAICVGWGNEETYSRRFSNSSGIYQEIVGRQRMLCCINENEAKILGAEGLMAAPLIDADSGKVFGMLKIEDIGFNKLTLSNVECFRILCEVTGLAHSNAEKYRQAEINSIMNQENDLFSYTYFQQQSAFFTQLAKHSLLSPAIISLKIKQMKQVTAKEKARLAEQVQKIVHDNIEGASQLFNGKKYGTEFHIMLPNCSEDLLQRYTVVIKQCFSESVKMLSAGTEMSVDAGMLRKK